MAANLPWAHAELRVCAPPHPSPAPSSASAGTAAAALDAAGEPLLDAFDEDGLSLEDADHLAALLGGGALPVPPPRRSRPAPPSSPPRPPRQRSCAGTRRPW